MILIDIHNKVKDKQQYWTSLHTTENYI